MAKKFINMHQLMADLKLTNKKIQHKLDAQDRESIFVTYQAGENALVNGVNPEDAKSVLTGNWASIQALIENAKAYEKARIMSNSVTKITIGGVDMTVAEAIKTKESLDTYETLLRAMKTQYAMVLNTIDRENNRVMNEFNANIKTIEKSENASALKAMFEETAEKSKSRLFDPIGIANAIKTLEEYIDTFTTEVDAALSVSNATTMVEVDLAD